MWPPLPARTTFPSTVGDGGVDEGNDDALCIVSITEVHCKAVVCFIVLLGNLKRKKINQIESQMTP